MNTQLASVVLSVLLTAQADPSPTVKFEVASVKQNKSGGAGSSVGRQPGGRLNAQNATLRELILYAYPIQRFQLSGGASWLDSDRWDIVAKLDSSLPSLQPPPSNEALALRTLLADQFGLKVHWETRELPIYALVLARTDRKPGPEMKLSDIDCKARGCGIRGRIGSMQGVGASMADFAGSLSERVGRSVVDRTGLQGNWDFTLTHSQDPSQLSADVLATGDPRPPEDPTKPTIFTALQEQLGLKLDAQRGPVQVMVIDSMARPIG